MPLEVPAPLPPMVGLLVLLPEPPITLVPGPLVVLLLPMLPLGFEVWALAAMVKRAAAVAPTSNFSVMSMLLVC